MNATEYLSEIGRYYADENSSEMSYRTAFQNYLTTIFPKEQNYHIQHDQRMIDGNKPDFIVLKGQVPILYIEMKKVGEDLDKIENSQQAERYFGYTNLIISDYLEFRFFRNGQRYNEPIPLATIDKNGKAVIPCIGQEQVLERTVTDFVTSQREPIKRGSHLAKIMGGKARRIHDNLLQFVSTESEQNKGLLQVYDTIKQMLVHDLTHETFADMYAQTLVYGLFVARYHDDTLKTFSRQEARDLVPTSNPFLRHFFDHITGPDFDKRLSYIVDELCEVFQHADTKKLVEEYMGDADPVIHFYEDFLKEYDPGLRKKMGAYYTPLPVVNFVVRSVDHILENEFGLAQGLADISKLEDGKTHRVQILDPAVGTGTFISRVIAVIYERILKQKQKGRWTTYVHRELLPRLHGFELMMAPYTIAHLKLSLAFKKTGFHYFLERLGIYLTNALEKAEENPDTIAFGLAETIAEESKQAAVIKNETPIMVVIGNPPYSVSSSNKGKWIQEQIKVYKEGLGERKINLDDDYIKFIRYAEHFIEKNKTGVVAMITNNSFLDGVTHRQMRKHLLKTFDKIHILNLHGSSRIGGKENDENVFDIQQGVSVNIFVRTKYKSSKLGDVHYFEITGTRESKFEKLNTMKFNGVTWQKLDVASQNYFFVPKDFKLQSEYEKGFKITEMYQVSNTGIQTKRDKVTLAFTESELLKRINHFLTLDIEKIRNKYSLPADGRDWSIAWAKQDLEYSDYTVIDILYRPFDIRKTVYTGKSKGFLAYPRESVTKHFVNNRNLGLVTVRMCAREEQFVSLVTNSMIEKGSLPAANFSIFPLYLYSEDGTKTPNLDEKIVKEIENIVGKTTPEDIFDYIYAVLHSSTYREKYKEFLKIDFPRVPFPEDAKQFKALVALGRELREIHLLESPKVSEYITSYPEAGSDTVEKVTYKDGRVYINSEQYFGDVAEVAWNFYMGGYQPAQKWLKSRKGRQLTNEDIEHYQKIIVALTETDRIMKEIDKVVSL